MNDFYLSAGQRICNVRKEQKMSRAVLAEKTEISSKFLYEIENGIKGFSSDTCFRISRALGVSCEYILSGQPKIDINNLNEQLKTFTLNAKEDVVALLNCCINCIKTD